MQQKFRFYKNKTYIVEFIDHICTYTGKELKENELLMYKIICGHARIIGSFY